MYEPRVAEVARTDVPTCRLEEPAGKVVARARAAGFETAFVVDEEGVVLGRLFGSDVDDASDAVVEDVMRAGPSTFRPHLSVGRLLRYMREHELETTPITTSGGRLVGLLLREDAERAAEGSASSVDEARPAGGG